MQKHNNSKLYKLKNYFYTEALDGFVVKWAKALLKIEFILAMRLRGPREDQLVYKMLLQGINYLRSHQIFQ